MIVDRLNNPRLGYIFGVLSFLLFSFSLLIGYEEVSVCHTLVAVKCLLVFLSAVLYVFSCSKDSSERIKFQYSVLSLLILTVQLIVIISVGRTILYIRDYPAILSSVVWVVAGLYSVCRFRKVIYSFCVATLKKRVQLVLVVSSVVTALLVVVLSVEQHGIRFIWDSDTLYEFVLGLEYDSLYDVHKLLFYNHVSVVYIYILVLLKLLIGNLRIAFFLLNSLCILVASCGMTFLVKAIIPNKKLYAYIVANAIFMFSPWVCGMSTYYMYDYYIWCLYPILILFYSKNNRIGIFVIGCLIAFSRSTGLIVFGSVCLGSWILDYKSEGLGTLKKIKYWYYGAVAIVFYAFFSMGVDKSGQFLDTTIGFNIQHIIHILKLYFVTNFLWVFSLLSIMCLIHVFIRPKRSLTVDGENVVFLLFFSDIMLFIFYCLFITYRIPRYMDSHISVLYILSAFFLVDISDKRLTKYAMVALWLLSFIASFRMIDPMSLAVFKTLNVGTHDVVDFEMMGPPSLNDSIICNREYYSYLALHDKVLKDVVESMSSKDEILFSLGNQELTWGLSGGRYSYNFNDDKHYFEEFYNLATDGMANGYSYEYYDAQEMVPLLIHYIFPEETVQKAISISNAQEFYYIYMPTLNNSKENEIYRDFNVISNDEYNVRGWVMNCIKFTR